MTVAHLLRDFGQANPTGSQRQGQDESEIGAESFETGYKAGWDDALSAKTQESSDFGEEFARHLQDLSFTYHEAHGHIIKSLEPLLTELVGKLLPGVAQASMLPTIVEQLTNTARAATETPVEIRVAEAKVDTLSAIAEQDFGFPVTVVGDAAMSDGQASIGFDDQEKKIDFDQVLSQSASTIQAFFETNTKELTDG